MDGPIELVNSAENVNGRRGGTVYEVLSHDRMQDGEYMTIGSANEDDTGKHQAGQQGTNKKNEKIEKKLADQSKYLNILKLITIILTITVVITSVTFGVLIHKLMGRIKDHEHALVDGAWSVWSPWESCSTSCKQGTTLRIRSCSNPSPQNGGKTCTGNNTETKHCTLRACPVHGGWGTWAHWSSCSSTCGQGITRRTRVCDNPRPQLLENFCFGDSTEYGMCLIKHCPVDGNWNGWSLWSSCSLTCGAGQMTRQRLCSNSIPENGGHNCIGGSLEHKNCQADPCPDNTIPTIVFNTINVTTTSPLTRQPVVFSSVVSNIGNGYSPTTGKFTAPVNGTYSFIVQLCLFFKLGQHTQPDFSLVLGGNAVTASHQYHINGVIMPLTTVPLFLQKGEKVWVQPMNSCSSCLNNNSTWTCSNRFSGTLIHK